MVAAQLTGFTYVADWLLDGDGIDVSCGIERGPAVYAFAVDDVVVYIGKTVRCLRSRMYGYRKGAGTQQTNIRVRGLLIEALKNGSKVQILSARPDSSTWQGWPVNVVVGLEDGLIAQIKPTWNMIGNGKGAR